jgi:Spy/CpxP family protein refolding chaperone
MKKIAIITLIMMTGLILFAQDYQQPRAEQLRTRRDPELRQRPEHHNFHDADAEDFPLIEELDLTEQQKEQIRTFRHNHRLEMIDLRAEAAKITLEIREAMQKPDFRTAKKLNDQLYTKKGEIAGKGIDLREKIHQVLTEEQREQVKQMQRKQRQRKRMMPNPGK